MNTHYVPYDAGNRALCGDFVDVELHDVEPTCRGCQTAIAADTLSIESIDPPPPQAEPEPRELPRLRVLSDEDGANRRPGADGEDLAAALASLGQHALDMTDRRGEWLGLPRDVVVTFVANGQHAAPDVVREPEPPFDPPAPIDAPGASQAPPQSGLTVVVETEPLIAEAKALEITNAATLERGEYLYGLLLAFEAEVHAEHDVDCKKAYDSWKHQTTKRAKRLDPIEATKPLLGDRIAAYRQFLKDEVARQQREAEAAARREQQAQADREALQVREEAARVLRDAEADAAKAPGTVRSAAQLVAAQALATDLRQQADQVVEDAKHAPLPVLPARPAPVSTDTLTDKKRWVAELTNWTQLRADIGTGRYPEWDAALQEVVLSALNKLAPQLKQALGVKYPGAEARQKASLARK